MRPDHASSPEDGAAYWDARLRSPLCTPEDRAAFAEWRDVDPSHAAAFDRLRGALALLHGAYESSPELRAYRDQALRRPLPIRLIAASVAAVVVVGVGVAVLRLPAGSPGAHQAPAVASSTYETAVGERSVLQLSDGSKVTLNTRSRIEVAYTASRRSVRLLAGQAMFEVAKNKARPFVVSAGWEQVTAVGTAFDVRLEPALVQVTMVEGKVRVGQQDQSGTNASRATQDLVAGQQLTASAAGTTSVASVDSRRATGWTEGRELFEDEPLPEAVAEINRYLAKPVRIADPRLASIRINGMFRTDQPMSFVRALESYLPVELREDPSGPVLTRRTARSAQ